MSAARGVDVILPTYVTPAVDMEALGLVKRHERSLGGFHFNRMPVISSDKGLPRAKLAVLGEIARSTELPAYFRLRYDRTPKHQRPPKRAQKPYNRLDWRYT